MRSTLRRQHKYRHTVNEAILKTVSLLYKRDWKQTDRQGKTVYNVTRGGSPTLETLQLVADKANVPAWYLLLPLDEKLLESPELAELVYAFIEASPETRRSILHILKNLNN